MRVTNAFALSALTFVVGCGVPLPFNYDSEQFPVDISEVMGDGAVTLPENDQIPDGAPADAEEARALLAQYLGEAETNDIWPEGAEELRIDIPLVHKFDVDLSNDPNVTQMAGRLSAIAVDKLEVEFVQNTLNYPIPSVYFLTVNDGVELPAAEEIDLANLPSGVNNVGHMTGLEPGASGTFGLEYSETGKQDLSDTVLSLKFSIAVFSRIEFNSAVEELFPSGGATVSASIAGRLLPQ